MNVTSVEDVRPGRFIALGNSTFIKLHPSVKPAQVGLAENTSVENLNLIVDIERNAGAAYILPKTFGVTLVDIDFFVEDHCVVRTWGEKWAANLEQKELAKIKPFSSFDPIKPGTITLFEYDTYAALLFRLNEGTLIGLADGKIFLARPGLCFPVTYTVYRDKTKDTQL